MNIFDLQLGFGNDVPNLISLNIYFSGCHDNKKCNRIKCHNSHLHSFDNGIFYQNYYNQICTILSKTMVQCICLLGGEPLDQNITHLKNLIDYIKSIKADIDIYCYTGYDYKDNKDIIDNFISLFNIKDIFVGPYLTNQNNQQWLRKTFK